MAKSSFKGSFMVIGVLLALLFPLLIAAATLSVIESMYKSAKKYFQQKQQKKSSAC